MAEGQKKIYWRKRFKNLGVNNDRIFNEILRAREIDQVLFANPENQLYGVDGDTIMRTMREVTLGKFGPLPCREEKYLRVFETAMATPPMLFAPYPAYTGGHLAFSAWWQRNSGAKHILLWGAEYYLQAIEEALKIFTAGTVTALVKKDKDADCLSLIYPQVEWFTYDSLPADRRFDYIFAFGYEDSPISDWERAWAHLAAGGTATAWWPLREAREVKALPKQGEASFYVRSSNRLDDDIIAIYQEGMTADYGQATYRNSEWRLTSRGIRYWEERVLDRCANQRIADVADVLTEEERYADNQPLVLEAVLNNMPLTANDMATDSHTLRAYRLQKGDVLVVQDRVGYRSAIVAETVENVFAVPRITVLRPKKEADSWPLFLFLQTAECHRLAQYFSGEGKLRWNPIRWARLPLPFHHGEAGAETELLKAHQAYSKALAKWEKALTKAVEDVWGENEADK